MFSIIVAKSINNIIGINNSLPWNLPSDLKRFKEITMGKKILMGNKTVATNLNKTIQMCIEV